MMKFVETSGVRHIDEDNWRAVDKAAGRNGAHESIFDWRMRNSGAGAALRAPVTRRWFLADAAKSDDEEKKQRSTRWRKNSQVRAADQVHTRPAGS